MKKKNWMEPKLITLGLEDTRYDSSIGHLCHQQDNNCPNFEGEHTKAGHTIPEWNNEHWHTCCCEAPGES